MTKYEELLDFAYTQGIEVYEFPFQSERIKGLYADNVIGINSNLKTSAEKITILAEELGHHYTTVGDITDTSNPDNAWQEAKARLWGFRKLVSRELIIDALRHGCKTIFETADYLELPVDYLVRAMSTFQLVEQNSDLFEEDI